MRIAVGLAFALFVAGLAVVSYRFTGAKRETEPDGAGAEGLERDQLERELASLRKVHAALTVRVSALEDRAEEAQAGRGPGGAHAKIEAVETDASADETPGAPPAGNEPPADREEQIAAAIRELTAPGSSEKDWQRIWSQVGKAGLIDDVVAAFEERVKAEPRSADQHALLGAAYLQKLVTVNDLEKGPWAMKSDKAFDDALALDDHHWQARFTKAASLSYWPAITGKPAEAVEHFETLRAQQEEGPAQNKFANTYLMLGNLYQSQGNTARARETWQRGAELHPDNAELRAKAESAAGK